MNQRDENGFPILYFGDILDGRYKVISCLGNGTQGIVLDANDMLDPSRDRVAIKIYSESKAKVAASEIRVLEKLTEINRDDDIPFVKYYGCFEYLNCVCLVLERMDSSLLDYIKRIDPARIKLDEVCKIGFQLCRAVNFLHQNRYIHCDIKVDNVLFAADPTTTDNVAIRLVDFGLTTLDQGGNYNWIVHAAEHRAPEIYLKLGWSYACDVWAIGCLLLQLYTYKPLIKSKGYELDVMECLLGKIPREMLNGFERVEPGSAKAKELRRKYKPLYKYRRSKCRDHVLLFDLIKRMLVYRPEERITLEEALEHDFFKTHN